MEKATFVNGNNFDIPYGQIIKLFQQYQTINIVFKHIHKMNYDFQKTISQIRESRVEGHMKGSRLGLTASEVSKITQSQVKEGELAKGDSRIEYVPYDRKFIEYEDRQRIERIPIKRKIIEYQQKVIVEEIPREVVTTDYFAIENITRYYKQVAVEKNIEMVAVQKKRKIVEYVPVHKQIVHYPENQDLDFARNQGKLILYNQGVSIGNNVEFRPLDPKLIYKYSTAHCQKPIGYVENGLERNLSTAPTFPLQHNPITPRSPYNNSKTLEQKPKQFSQVSTSYKI